MSVPARSGELLNRRLVLHVSHSMAKAIDDAARENLLTPSAWARAAFLQKLREENGLAVRRRAGRMQHRRLVETAA